MRDLATLLLASIIEARFGIRLERPSRAGIDFLLRLVGNPSADFRDEEFAGATFSPDGQRLFFNIQSPGTTFAVSGPFAAGGL